MPYETRPTRQRYGDRWHDQKAPDGFTINGWRKVTKAGYVRLCGGNHYHEALQAMAGLWVFAEIADGFGINVDVWPDEPWKDHKTVLNCTNENDWFADDPKGAAKVSRRHARSTGSTSV